MTAAWFIAHVYAETPTGLESHRTYSFDYCAYALSSPQGVSDPDTSRGEFEQVGLGTFFDQHLEPAVPMADGGALGCETFVSEALDLVEIRSRTCQIGIP